MHEQSTNIIFHSKTIQGKNYMTHILYPYFGFFLDVFQIELIRHQSIPAVIFQYRNHEIQFAAVCAEH